MPINLFFKNQNRKVVSSKTKPLVLWLGTNTCAGDALSFLNALDPNYQKLCSEIIDLRFNYLTSAAEGDMANDILDSTLKKNRGKYILAVEGSIPLRSNGLYSVMGNRNGKLLTALEVVRKLSHGARHVIAVGTCAAFGGPYAAEPNPSESVPLQAVLDRKVINVPGCPINPDWMMGTLVHLARYGEPELDSYNRPKMFFSETIHNLCQRRSYFDDGIFAKNPGEPWCMYKIGCKGPTTYADCPNRMWNGEHLSWPVKANTPCIGCTSPEFPDGDTPFFQHLPDIDLPGVKISANRLGLLTGVVTAIGISAHFAGSILTGRLANTIKKDFSGGVKMKIMKIFKNEK